MEPKNWLGAKIGAVLVAIVIYIRVARSLYTGEVLTGRVGRVRRNQQPLQYWLYMAIYAAIPILFGWMVFHRAR